MNLKQEVYKVLGQLDGYKNLESLIIESIDASKGDYCLPCFSLAKIMRKSPIMIADEIANMLNLRDTNIEKVESVAGYVNFFLNRVKPYNPKGRNQSEKESDAISDEVLMLLYEYGIDCEHVNGDSEGYQYIVDQVCKLLNKDKEE